MPFTPFHLGPLLVIGLLLRNRLHAPTLLIGSIILDVEPLLVLVYGLPYPLHGYAHTLIASLAIGLATGYILYKLERFLRILWLPLKLETRNQLSLKTYLVAGALGTVSHILLDTPLYSDIKPFYPFGVNPLYNPGLTILIYQSCLLLGSIGLTYYILLLFRGE